MLNSWLHLIALIVYLGAIVGLWVLLFPALIWLNKHDDKVRFLTRGLKLYNPLQVGALGILLFSGAFQLTELKATYRELFLKQLGYALALKLLFAFFLVMVSVYQSLGVGHRFVRRQEGGQPVTPEQLNSIVRRLKGANGTILILAMITVWLGIRLRSW
jgi:uncharacterized membrane protein